MKELREALEEYLEVRRMFRFKLRAAGSLLHQFVSFVERCKIHPASNTKSNLNRTPNPMMPKR